MKKSLLALALLAAAAQASAQSAGSIAIIAANTDSPDNFAWVALSDIDAGTVINFTDSSWQATAFRGTEHLNAGGPLTWTASQAVSAGTVVRYGDTAPNTWSIGTVGGATMSISSGGDQIFAYQGSNSSPSFLYGLQLASASGIVNAPTVSSSTNTTNVPSALTLGSTMLNLGNFDNGYYSGTTSGTAEELLAAIGDTNNWTRSDNVQAASQWATAFTVTAVPEPETYAMLLAGLAVLGAAARRRNAA